MPHPLRNLGALRLAPAALLLSACGVGGGLLAAAGGGGGGGGGSSPPAPPSVTVTAPPGQSNANLIRLAYVLRDPQVRPAKVRPDDEEPRPGGEDDPRVRVAGEWQFVAPGADPEVWFPMTEAGVAESDGQRALPLGQHIFVWNTLPDLAGAQGRFRVRVRITAEYEEVAGIRRSFRVRDAVMTVDNRLAGTVLGGEVQPATDVDTFPVDLRPDGEGFVVADFGANIVERVDGNGLVRRLLGFGVPGDTVGSGKSPGVARLQTLIGVELDGAGNLVTNNTSSLLVTNRGGAPLVFGSVTVPPFTVVRGVSGLSNSRDVRFHPSGALLFLNDGTSLLALNPRAPGGPDIVLGGVTVPAGDAAVLVGGGAADDDGLTGSATRVEGASGVAVGPDGEIYYLEQSLARVRCLNVRPTDVVVGGATVAPGTVRTVAGTGAPGFSGDGGAATAAALQSPAAIDVNAARVLFVADTGNVRVRAANLGPADFTWAETTVRPGEVETVVGGGSGGVGSKARELRLGRPNALTLDANGNLLIADQRSVILVNGGTAAVTSYGRTAGAARTAGVHDTSRRGGVPLADPRAVHSTAPTEVFVTDRSTLRVMNLDDQARVFGGEAALPGETVIVGGGSVPGFGGDGGSARSAAFSSPSALAREGPRRLWVADTGNDRVRLVNLGDPRYGAAEAESVLGVTVAPGHVDTVVGGSPVPLFSDGDGGPARGCSLADPEAVAVGLDGLVWVADTGHHRIRVVNPGPAAVTVAGVVVSPGEIETVLGSGTAGSTPDGPGPWLVAAPSALWIDAQGVVYFAERGNARIRCLNPTADDVERAGLTVLPGEVRTLVGTGVPGNSGDGGDGPSARIVAPRSLFVQSRGDGTPVALYFADEGAHVVRMLNLSKDDDLALATDGLGNVTVTIPAASVYTVAGGPNTPGFDNAPAFAGDGEEAARVRFAQPFGIAVTTSGGQPAHFFVADRGNDRLRRFAAPPLTKTNR